VTRAFSTEIYIVLLAAGFAGLGLWAGRRLTQRRAPRDSNATTPLSARWVLRLVNAKCSNSSLRPVDKEMARQLGISPNTAKTHVARVYQKLEVQRRIQAIHKARELALIP
jgi:ATP/maltotriose-dependent transcriptional regulator MalT